MAEVIRTGKPWYVKDFETPIPGRQGPTWWEGECIPVASKGTDIDSVLVINWEITERKLAERAMRDALQGAAKNR
jgi:hypothetical protein